MASIWDGGWGLLLKQGALSASLPNFNYTVHRKGSKFLPKHQTRCLFSSLHKHIIKIDYKQNSTDVDTHTQTISNHLKQDKTELMLNKHARKYPRFQNKTCFPIKFYSSHGVFRVGERLTTNIFSSAGISRVWWKTITHCHQGWSCICSAACFTPWEKPKACLFFPRRVENPNIFFLCVNAENNKLHEEILCSTQLSHSVFCHDATAGVDR